MFYITETMNHSIINYSIIIAHKNIPDLLVRCLDSIPVRDDIQVIVVDDNSDPGVVSFEHFPQWGGRHFECCFTKEGRGAGYVRNVALTHARGKWVTIMDADDYYTEDFPSFLDRMVDAEEDLIIFDHRSVLNDDISVSVSRAEYLSKLIQDFRNHRIDEKKIRRSYEVAHCKLVRRDLIEKHGIRFHEVKWGNDIFFSAQVACFAESIRVCDDIIYVMTVRRGSLTADFCGTRKEALTRLQEAIACDNLFKEHGLSTQNGYTNSVLRLIHERHSFLECTGYCLSSIGNWPVAKVLAHSLAQKIRRHIGS